jgi:predicted HD phosphohydrolase
MSTATPYVDAATTMTGYSDRINHAFAFAAKHHDRQVRKGTRLPYLTHPANVAIILSRYGRDDETVIAGILHDVIEDCVREGWTREMLEDRIAAKFGDAVLATVLAVTKRRADDNGVEFSRDDVRTDYLERLSAASESARWVCAADKVHNLGSTSTRSGDASPAGARAPSSGTATSVTASPRSGSTRRSCESSRRSWSSSRAPDAPVRCRVLDACRRRVGALDVLVEDLEELGHDPVPLQRDA